MALYPYYNTKYSGKNTMKIQIMTMIFLLSLLDTSKSNFMGLGEHFMLQKTKYHL